MCFISHLNDATFLRNKHLWVEQQSWKCCYIFPMPTLLLIGPISIGNEQALYLLRWCSSSSSSKSHWEWMRKSSFPVALALLRCAAHLQSAELSNVENKYGLLELVYYKVSQNNVCTRQGKKHQYSICISTSTHVGTTFKVWSNDDNAECWCTMFSQQVALPAWT